MSQSSARALYGGDRAVHDAEIRKAATLFSGTCILQMVTPASNLNCLILTRFVFAAHLFEKVGFALGHRAEPTNALLILRPPACSGSFLNLGPNRVHFELLVFPLELRATLQRSSCFVEPSHAHFERSFADAVAAQLYRFPDLFVRAQLWPQGGCHACSR